MWGATFGSVLFCRVCPNHRTRLFGPVPVRRIHLTRMLAPSTVFCGSLQPSFWTHRVQGLETAKQLKKSAVLDDIGDALLNSASGSSGSELARGWG